MELECSVQYATEYTVLWVKSTRDRGDFVFLSTGSSLVIKDSRFALRYDPSSSTYTLQIKDIQETDAGTYQCQVILSVNNKIAADVDLSVRRPPVISDNSTQSLVVSEGKSVQMECYAGGYPHPTITWRRENNAILPTGEFVNLLCSGFTRKSGTLNLIFILFGKERPRLTSGAYKQQNQRENAHVHFFKKRCFHAFSVHFLPELYETIHRQRKGVNHNNFGKHTAHICGMHA